MGHERNCRVLVVEDDPAMQEVLRARLERWGYPVAVAGDGKAARSSIVEFSPHVILSDLVLPDITGLDILDLARRHDPSCTVLLLTAYGTVGAAVSAIKGGATDFLTKPLDYVALRKMLDAIEVSPEAASIGGERPPASTREGMVGSSPAHLEMLRELDVAASSDAPVLIVGPSGSGKELVAQTVHRRSARRAKPFVPVNAAAVPTDLVEAEFFGFERGAFTGAHETRDGLFRQAHRGTLFLDEVTEMPLSVQPKLLRVIEEGQVRRVGSSRAEAVDVRLVAATNRDPLEAVAGGHLREDLLYRLDVLRVDVPPLSRRREDIPALVEHFAAGAAQRYRVAVPSFQPGAVQVLTDRPWPGNVRELRNVVERAVLRARGDAVEAHDLGPSVHEQPRPRDPGRHGVVIPHGSTAAEAERILITETLRRTNNNKAETARRLGLDVKTIRNKLRGFARGSEA